MFLRRGRPYSLNETPGPEAVLRSDDHWSTHGLVGYWPMLEGRGGLIRSHSSYRYHGRGINAPTWRPGLRGWALGFDAASQQCVAADVHWLPEFTLVSNICATADVSDWHTIMAKSSSAPQESRNFFLALREFTGELVLRVEVKPSECVGPALNDNRWHHVAGTFAAGQVKLYADGACVDTNVYTDPLTGATDQFYIGYMAETFPRYFDGAIGVTGVYDRALSADEIAELHVQPYTPLWRPARVSVWDLAALAVEEAIAGATVLAVPARAQAQALPVAVSTDTVVETAPATAQAQALAGAVMVSGEVVIAAASAVARAEALPVAVRGDATVAAAAPAQAQAEALPSSPSGGATIVGEAATTQAQALAGAVLVGYGTIIASVPARARAEALPSSLSADVTVQAAPATVQAQALPSVVNCDAIVPATPAQAQIQALPCSLGADATVGAVVAQAIVKASPGAVLSTADAVVEAAPARAQVEALPGSPSTDATVVATPAQARANALPGSLCVEAAVEAAVAIAVAKALAGVATSTADAMIAATAASAQVEPLPCDISTDAAIEATVAQAVAKALAGTVMDTADVLVEATPAGAIATALGGSPMVARRHAHWNAGISDVNRGWR